MRRTRLMDFAQGAGEERPLVILDWDMSGGVARARNAETLGWFKALQRALNAWHARRGSGTHLVVDGVIGPQTASIARGVTAAIRSEDKSQAIASDIDRLVTFADAFAWDIARAAGVAIDTNPNKSPGDERPVAPTRRSGRGKAAIAAGVMVGLLAALAITKDD